MLKGHNFKSCGEFWVHSMGDLGTPLILYVNICYGTMFVFYMKFDVLSGLFQW